MENMVVDDDRESRKRMELRCTTLGCLLLTLAALSGGALGHLLVASLARLGNDTESSNVMHGGDHSQNVHDACGKSETELVSHL